MEVGPHLQRGPGSAAPKPRPAAPPPRPRRAGPSPLSPSGAPTPDAAWHRAQPPPPQQQHVPLALIPSRPRSAGAPALGSLRARPLGEATPWERPARGARRALRRRSLGLGGGTGGGGGRLVPAGRWSSGRRRRRRKGRGRSGRDLETPKCPRPCTAGSLPASWAKCGNSRCTLSTPPTTTRSICRRR